eukprot:PITA_05719
MDDFTPYGSSFQEALSNLGKVLSKCIEMNLSLSPEKCEFLMTEGTVLGNTISRQGLQVDPSKIAIIKKVPPPQKQFDLTIVEKPGKENVVADFSSRLDLPAVPSHLSSKEKSRIMRKSASFTWIGDNLFKLGPDKILRHCVREEEVFDILLTCHDGPCGGNFSAKRTAFKILQAGYYWPTLHQDFRRYVSHSG